MRLTNRWLQKSRLIHHKTISLSGSTRQVINDKSASPIVCIREAEMSSEQNLAHFSAEEWPAEQGCENTEIEQPGDQWYQPDDGQDRPASTPDAHQTQDNQYNPGQDADQPASCR